MKARNRSVACASAVLVATSLWLARDSGAWDSAYHNPTHPTHTYITDWAINQLRPDLPKLGQFRDALVDGANTELHELPVRDFEKKLGVKYGMDLEAKRKAHRGT